MILIDSNVPMYLVGGPHPHKMDSQRLVARLLSGGQRLVTDTEVLQELLHRYGALRRYDAIQPAFDAVRRIVDQIFSIDHPTMERAKQIVLAYQRVSARDAVHLAVMEHHGIEQILSFDSGFDGFPGITRVS